MHLTTSYSEHIIPQQVLPEYPRPCFKRDSYINLNGFWDYAITTTRTIPKQFDGKILVPFSPEAPLSGVNHILQPEEFLWYQKSLPVPVLKKGERLLLHFGAVDQHASIYINNRKVLSHTGGYLPFTVDITPYLHVDNNILLVRVRDVTDTSYHSRGKQSLQPKGMFYTPQSGIWQTVWMECVPHHYITHVHIIPLYDEEAVKIQLFTSITSGNCSSYAEILEGIAEPLCSDILPLSPNSQPIASGEFNEKGLLTIPLPHFKSWSPEYPFLYTVRIYSGEDRVESYFAMRKFSMDMDQQGFMRLFLNNKPYFHNGLLDQGYWPEGLYTAPTDEALLSDIQKAKELGFNMLRKHAKIEPLRWYYHCDRLGILVWQDMVNGGSHYHKGLVTYMPTIFTKSAKRIKDNHYRLLSRSSEKGRQEYLEELQSTLLLLYNIPCIAMWVPFNEGWGQFDALRIVSEIRSLDSTRTIDHASGWFDQMGGDVKSLHIYFTPFIFKPDHRALVLSEFGGYALRIPKHSYSDKAYGYRYYQTSESLTAAYRRLYERTILPGIKKGLSACVYTQLTDVEEEINGLITYDRSILKLEANVVKEINQKLHY